MKVRYKGSKWIDVCFFLLVLIADIVIVVLSLISKRNELTNGFFIRSSVVIVLFGYFVINTLRLVLNSYISYNDKYLIMNIIDLYSKDRKRTWNKSGPTIRIDKKRLLIKDIKEIRIKDNVLIKSNKDDIVLSLKEFNKNKLIKLFNNIKDINNKIIIKNNN